MTPADYPTPSADWCLFLDVDGTLIELTDTPFDTQAGSELKATLQRLSARLNGAVALVSGRAIEYLDALFAPLRLPAAGLHGVERRTAAGAEHGATFIDARLDRARVAFQELVSAHPGTLLEDKGRNVAVHYRLAPQFEQEIRDAVNAIAGSLGPDYHVQGGNMMLELKPAGFSKGSAIQAFMQEVPFKGRTPVFAGDDLTDLDGFRKVEDLGGLSVSVGDRVKGQFHLQNPTAVRAWLAQIAALPASGSDLPATPN